MQRQPTAVVWRPHTRAGIDTLGASLIRTLGPHATYQWCAEGCSIAQRAHRAFWQALGQAPTLWTAAEAPALADMEHRVDMRARHPPLCAVLFQEPLVPEGRRGSSTRTIRGREGCAKTFAAPDHLRKHRRPLAQGIAAPSRGTHTTVDRRLPVGGDQSVAAHSRGGACATTACVLRWHPQTDAAAQAPCRLRVLGA